MESYLHTSAEDEETDFPYPCLMCPGDESLPCYSLPLERINIRSNSLKLLHLDSVDYPSNPSRFTKPLFVKGLFALESDDIESPYDKGEQHEAGFKSINQRIKKTYSVSCYDNVAVIFLTIPCSSMMMNTIDINILTEWTKSSVLNTQKLSSSCDTPALNYWEIFGKQYWNLPFAEFLCPWSEEVQFPRELLGKWSPSAKLNELGVKLGFKVSYEECSPNEIPDVKSSINVDSTNTYYMKAVLRNSNQEFIDQMIPHNGPFTNKIAAKNAAAILVIIYFHDRFLSNANKEYLNFKPLCSRDNFYASYASHFDNNVAGSKNDQLYHVEQKDQDHSSQISHPNSLKSEHSYISPSSFQQPSQSVTSYSPSCSTQESSNGSIQQKLEANDPPISSSAVQSAFDEFLPDSIKIPSLESFRTISPISKRIDLTTDMRLVKIHVETPSKLGAYPSAGCRVDAFVSIVQLQSKNSKSFDPIQDLSAEERKKKKLVTDSIDPTPSTMPSIEDQGVTLLDEHELEDLSSTAWTTLLFGSDETVVPFIALSSMRIGESAMFWMHEAITPNKQCPWLLCIHIPFATTIRHEPNLPLIVDASTPLSGRIQSGHKYRKDAVAQYKLENYKIALDHYLLALRSLSHKNSLFKAKKDELDLEQISNLPSHSSSHKSAFSLKEIEEMKQLYVNLKMGIAACCLYIKQWPHFHKTWNAHSGPATEGIKQLTDVLDLIPDHFHARRRRALLRILGRKLEEAEQDLVACSKLKEAESPEGAKSLNDAYKELNQSKSQEIDGISFLAKQLMK